MKTRALSKVCLLVAGLLLVSCDRSPLSRPERAIREDLMSRAPLGTSKDVVKTEFAPSIRVEQGDVSAEVANYPSEHPVGVSFLRAHLGGYGFLMKTDVVAIYYFDADEKLLDIQVLKYREAT